MKFVKIFLKKKCIVDARVYHHPLLLLKGLRFSLPLQKGQALLLASPKENLQTIDMLFVFFPIDALWLDKNKKVIHIARNIAPFTPYIASPIPAQYILECPANSTAAISCNQKLSFSL
ncbi:DUF192 domain-containing protein [Candidatus Woesearchaeota archaeon]|nr:DUF192 domain-containing protein [Candidatus Woesearchaeota archaeon]